MKPYPLDTWKSLSQEQQRVLEIIFDIDQLKERRNRELGRDGVYNKSPASEWRWIWYEQVYRHQATIALLPRLREARLSRKADTILDDLVKAGLTEYRIDRVEVDGHKVTVHQYKLTRQGRAVARSGTGKPREKPLPPGTLQEWHWKALKLAYLAGKNGVEKGRRSRYGGIPWSTWVRLRNYKAGDLVEEYSGDLHDVVADGKLVTFVIYRRLRITTFGRQYYEQNRERYEAMYPAGEESD